MTEVDIIAEYDILLESLEIPIKKLDPRSKRTPEWELLSDIRNHFKIPNNCETRATLSTYLSTNVLFDDFFSFLIYKMRPFARMLVEVYDFLTQFGQTAHSSQTISEIRLGSDTAFPVNLKNMPREQVETIAAILGTRWKVDDLIRLQDLLNNLEYVAICDGKSFDDKCRQDCFQRCRERIRTVGEDVISILESGVIADRYKIIDENTTSGLLPDMTDHTSKSASVRNQLTERLQSFAKTYQQPKQITTKTKAAYDCIPDQVEGILPDSLYTQKQIKRVCDILESAKENVEIEVTQLKEFLKLPYWRHRNDLYEIWIIAKLCSLFPHSQIQFNNVDSNGRWHLPGNKQGKITDPVLRIISPTERFQVFTGLNLREFKFSSDKTVSNIGAMPDWLFCKEVDETANFELLANESSRFRNHKLLPAFIIECKAGASYRLLKTIRDTMVKKYLPLLEPTEGKALLVNYRRFSTVEELNNDLELRNNRRRTENGRIVAIESLAPMSEEQEEEFVNEIRDYFGLSNVAESENLQPPSDFRGFPEEADFMFVFDTTQSLKDCLNLFRKQIAGVIETLAQNFDSLRIGAIAIGDHCDERELYSIKSFPPLDDLNQTIEFIMNVPDTRGGDIPEAYEDALFELNAIAWRPIDNKVAIFIGDAYPHPPSECSNGIDWNEQISFLKNKGVVVHSIRFQNGSNEDRDLSEKFFKYMSEETGGLYMLADDHFNFDETTKRFTMSLVTSSQTAKTL